MVNSCMVLYGKLTQDGMAKNYRTGLEPHDSFVFTEPDILLT